jgi:hypothetical protein
VFILAVDESGEVLDHTEAYARPVLSVGQGEAGLPILVRASPESRFQHLAESGMVLGVAPILSLLLFFFCSRLWLCFVKYDWIGWSRVLGERRRASG